tara:strand:- start:2028 stop:2414 length:387 start_codon:yes stop_codon:yes gene_type:complete
MAELLYVAFWIVAAVIYSSLWMRVYKLHQEEGTIDSISAFPSSMLVWSHSAFLVIQPYFFFGIVGSFLFHSHFKWRVKKRRTTADVWWSYGYYVEKFQNINGVIVEWPVQLAATNLVGARGGSMRERK